MHSSTPQLSLASVGMHSCKVAWPTPLGLQHLLWFLVGNLRSVSLQSFLFPSCVCLKSVCVSVCSSSENHSLQRGCLEALHMLCSVFPPASLPQPWGCDCGIPSLLPIALSLHTASQLAWTVHGNDWLSLMFQSIPSPYRTAAVVRCLLFSFPFLLTLGHGPTGSEWPVSFLFILGSSGGL